MRNDRLTNYQLLEEKRNSKLLIYVTSDRKGLETQIAPDILTYFTRHLDTIGDVDKITLYLYTRGGNTITAWTLVNLIRNFCKEFEVIIPFNCHSAGTLISLGANNIVMTKQATLGPIDPSVNGPMNPQRPGFGPTQKVPVSVEFVTAYINMAKEEFNITDQKSLSDILINLSNKIHPLTLGQVYKSLSQIKMLAKRLLLKHSQDDDQHAKIIEFLCSESGSHDYTIHRDEAKESLGLNIEKPDEEIYNLIKDIYNDIEQELQLTERYDPKLIIGNQNTARYSFRRALIESTNGGCDVFLSEGNLAKITNPQGKISLQDSRLKEGWIHEN